MAVRNKVSDAPVPTIEDVFTYTFLADRVSDVAAPAESCLVSVVVVLAVGTSAPYVKVAIQNPILANDGVAGVNRGYNFNVNIYLIYQYYKKITS